MPKKEDKSASTSADGMIVSFSHAPTVVLVTISKVEANSIIVNL